MSPHGLARDARRFDIVVLGGSTILPHKQAVEEAEEVAQRLNEEFHTDIFNVVAAHCTA